MEAAHDILSPPMPPVQNALRLVREKEFQARQRMDEYEEATEAARAERDEIARQLVELSLFALEVAAIAGCTVERAKEVGATTYGDLATPENLQVIERRARLSLNVLSEHEQLLRGAPDEAAEAQIPPLDRFLRQSQSLVAACPITEIERVAALVGAPEKGHRCRVAYGALRGLLRRNVDADRDLASVLGELYASRHLSISECARFLNQSTADTVAEFERRGLWREAKELTVSDRDRLLAKIRDDRVARGGSAVASRQRALRSTIASERIEGVDAREWLTE